MLLFAAINGYLPLGGDVVALVVLLLAIVLLIPSILSSISKLLVACMRPWLGVES